MAGCHRVAVPRDLWHPNPSTTTRSVEPLDARHRVVILPEYRVVEASAAVQVVGDAVTNPGHVASEVIIAGVAEEAVAAEASVEAVGVAAAADHVIAGAAV